MSSDYRRSHLDAGATYDAEITSSPFDRYLATWEAHHLARIVPRLFPSGIPRYLDFACGTGRILRQLAPLAHEAVGVDISPGMLREAAANAPSARLVQADLTRDAPVLGRFDLVSAFRFFGNAQQSLRGEVLRALRDLLVPGGLLLLNNHRNPHALGAQIARLRGRPIDVDLTHRLLRDTLREAGFEIAERHPIGAWMIRASLMTTAGRDPAREARLERLFSAPWWTPLAPDAILVARRR